MTFMNENPPVKIRNNYCTAFLFFIFAVVTATPALRGAVNVTQYHNHANRDGMYIDPAFTRTAAASLKRDTNFLGTVSGNVYAQPLYIDNLPGAKPMIITVTESNNVYALD